MTNGTNDDIFILLGFNHLLQVRPILIGIFSILYIFTLLGNSLIIVLILKDKRLHTPMYFFLANLSMLDLLSPSATVPKMIADLASGEGKISVHKCFTQLFFIITFVATESPLLSIMAFDRYVAICNPLYYGSIINFKLCAKLTSGAWILGSLYSLLHTLLTNNIDFCGSNVINHFSCDLLPLIQLACSDIFLNIVLLNVSVFLNGICNFSVILSSYVSIANAIIKIKSREGRSKAFLTCASHLMVVSMYYGTIIISYLYSINSSSEPKSKTAAVIYTAVTPLLNFRNHDVKNALKKLF
eukprot:XP_002939210.1 PREDICTED: olfactory receptor 1G1-like [Xenopus tropicalis]